MGSQTIELMESIRGVVTILGKAEDTEAVHAEIEKFAGTYVTERDSNKKYMLFRNIILKLRKRGGN